MHSSGSVVLGFNTSNKHFRRCFDALRPQVQREARQMCGLMVLMDMAAAPAKLHLHTLQGIKVPSALDASKRVSVYTMHITADDRFKASFTFEEGTVYFRVCGEHDWVDENP